MAGEPTNANCDAHGCMTLASRKTTTTPDASVRATHQSLEPELIVMLARAPAGCSKKHPSAPSCRWVPLDKGSAERRVWRTNETPHRSDAADGVPRKVTHPTKSTSKSWPKEAISAPRQGERSAAQTGPAWHLTSDYSHFTRSDRFRAWRGPPTSPRRRRSR